MAEQEYPSSSWFGSVAKPSTSTASVTTISTESQITAEEGSGRPRSDSISSQSEESRSEKVWSHVPI
ncbi:hypothetical protein EON65_39685 [archaeon]|nr:MAG: hypothetical protein EON65_39685 [archaeon]